MNRDEESIDYILKYYEIRSSMRDACQKVISAQEKGDLQKAWKEQRIFNESVIGMLSALEQIILSKEAKREK